MGINKEKYSGSNNVDEVAWYSQNSKKTTHPVGSDSGSLYLYELKQKARITNISNQHVNHGNTMNLVSSDPLSFTIIDSNE